MSACPVELTARSGFVPVASSMLESMKIARPKPSAPGPSSEPRSSYRGLPSRVAYCVAHVTISSPPSAAPIRGQLAAKGSSVSTRIGACHWPPTKRETNTCGTPPLRLR